MRKQRLPNTWAAFFSLVIGIPFLVLIIRYFPTSTLLGNVLEGIGTYSAVSSLAYIIIFAIIGESPHEELKTVLINFRHFIRQKLLDLLTSKKANPLPEFIGRQEEMQLFTNALGRLDNHDTSALIIFGFSGVGKSTLMHEMANVAAKQGFIHYSESVPRARLGTPDMSDKPLENRAALESLTSFLVRTLQPRGEDFTDNQQPFAQLDRLIRHMDNTVIFIDEYPYYDKEWNQQFVWLADNLKLKQKRALLVASCRVKPSLGANVPIEYIQLGGFTQSEMHSYIRTWSETPLYTEVEQNFNAYYSKTQGNPKFIQLLFANPRAWQQSMQANRLQFGLASVNERTRPELADVDDLCEEIWNDIDSQDLKENISRLIVLTHIFPVFAETLAYRLVSDWPMTYRGMTRRSLLNQMPKPPEEVREFMLPDLFGDWGYARMKDEKRAFHLVVGEAYAAEKKDSTAAFLALQHFILSRSVQRVESVYSDVARYKFQHGEIRQMASLTESIIELQEHASVPGNLQEFHLTVMLDRAKSLLLSGKMLVALNQFQVVEQHKQALNLIQEAEMYMGIADCYRLTGDFTEKAKNNFHLAADKFREIGKESDAIAADVEFGHAFYMEGNAAKSLEIYDPLQRLCEENQIPGQRLADLYYRISKSRRLLGQFGSALEFSQKAEDLYTLDGDKVGIAKARWTKTSVLRLQEKYDEALDESAFVHQQFNETGYRARMFLLHDIAEIHRALKQFDQALKTYEEALSEISLAGDKNRIAQTLLGIAEVKRWRKQFIGEEFDTEDYTKPLEMFIKIGSKWGIVNTYIARALAHWPNRTASEQDLIRATDLLADVNLPLEQLFIEQLRKTYAPSLHALNFV